MRRRVSLPLFAAGAVLASLVVATPAQAHGYVSSPPSRQALCAQRKVPDCGQVQYEPQSVEAPKGSQKCSGGSRFTVLDDESRNWPATSVGSSVSFSWTLTARHATSTWVYYIAGSPIATFNDGGRQPGATVTHSVSLGGRTGRQKVLAVWNIADTAMAFYACVDLQVGGGGPNPTPTATSSPRPTPTPTATSSPRPTPTPTATSQPGGTWAAGTAYAVGARVTYGGLSYQCRQAHTALPGWEPPNVPSLWQQV